MIRLRFSADSYSGHGRALPRRGVALAAACVRLGLETPVQGTARLFASNATGLIVKLPGWTYPAVIDTVAGEVQFDNYGGAWGQQKELDRLLQAYAVEKARVEARKLGHSVTEQALADVTAGGEGIDQLMSPPDRSKAGFAFRRLGQKAISRAGNGPYGSFPLLELPRHPLKNASCAPQFA